MALKFLPDGSVIVRREGAVVRVDLRRRVLHIRPPGGSSYCRSESSLAETPRATYPLASVARIRLISEQGSWQAGLHLDGGDTVGLGAWSDLQAALTIASALGEVLSVPVETVRAKLLGPGSNRLSRVSTAVALAGADSESRPLGTGGRDSAMRQAERPSRYFASSPGTFGAPPGWAGVQETTGAYAPAAVSRVPFPPIAPWPAAGPSPAPQCFKSAAGQLEGSVSAGASRGASPVLGPPDDTIRRLRRAIGPWKEPTPPPRFPPPPRMSAAQADLQEALESLTPRSDAIPDATEVPWLPGPESPWTPSPKLPPVRSIGSYSDDETDGADAPPLWAVERTKKRAVDDEGPTQPMLTPVYRPVPSERWRRPDAPAPVKPPPSGRSAAVEALEIIEGTNPVILEIPGFNDRPPEPPGRTPPGQTPPGRTPPGQTPPGQTPPGQTPPPRRPPDRRPSSTRSRTPRSEQATAEALLVPPSDDAENAFLQVLLDSQFLSPREAALARTKAKVPEPDAGPGVDAAPSMLEKVRLAAEWLPIASIELAFGQL